MSYSLYVITNRLTEDGYVGVTSKSIYQRWKQHLAHMKSKVSNTKNRSLLYADMKQFGIENFEIEKIFTFHDKKKALETERRLQKNNAKFKRYSSRDLQRDRTPKFNGSFILKSKNETLVCKSAVSIARQFNVHRSSVIRAYNDGYLFLRKYVVERITRKEYEHRT